MRFRRAIIGRFSRLGLLAKATLVVGGSVVVLLGLGAYVAVGRVDETAKAGAEHAAINLAVAAKNATTEMVRLGDAEAVDAVLRGLASVPNVADLHWFGTAAARRAEPGLAPSPQDELERRVVATGLTQTQVDDERDTLRMVTPLIAEKSCVSCHPKVRPGEVMGGISVTVSTADWARARAWLATRAGITLGAGLLLVVSLIAWLLERVVVRPVLQVADAAEAIAQGHRHDPIPVNGRDEIGRLAKSFNYMATKVSEARAHLEEKVAQRTKVLEQTASDLARAAELADQRKQELEKTAAALARQAADLAETRDVTVFALAKLAESRDPETGEHLERIRSYCRILAEQLAREGPYADQIDQQFLDDLYRSSPLHDVGKVGIPDVILLKPGRLSASEFEIMKRHAVIGAEALEGAARSASGGFLHMAADIARHHHERYDGTGYPAGLRGSEIPLAARIVALADTYDALTTVRVYKAAFDPEVAELMIEGETGKQFDPVVVDAFRARRDDFRRVRELTTGGRPRPPTAAAVPDPDPVLAGRR